MICRTNEHGLTNVEMVLVGLDCAIEDAMAERAELRRHGLPVPATLQSRIMDLCARRGEWASRGGVVA